MTQLEAMLIERGNAMARSIGHASVNGNAFHCPKLSPAVPCTCGAGKQQAKALDDWQHVVAEVHNNLDT